MIRHQPRVQPWFFPQLSHEPQGGGSPNRFEGVPSFQDFFCDAFFSTGVEPRADGEPSFQDCQNLPEEKELRSAYF